jgi:glutathione synthase/RimK-type ligase-like ATP-grasp enzyme
MPISKIAFVTYQKAPQLTPDDALAIAPLRELDIDVMPAIWNDPAVNWQQFDAVIVRSCWDYHHQPSQFRQWLDLLKAQQIALWNPAEIIRWNMHKKYLQDLADKGVTIPPTVWIEAESSVDLFSLLKENRFEQAVIKPMISATAHQTYRTSPATARDDQPQLDEILRHTGAMVQKFVDEITTTGEWSLIFLAGKFSHAVLKRPGDGDFRVQADFGGTAHLHTPPTELIKQAEEILRLIEEPLLYARVDGVNSAGRLVLIELELIEPQLFLKMAAAAPQRFAEAIRLFCETQLG